VGMEKAQHVNPPAFSHRHFNPLTHGLPSIGHTGGEGETTGIEKIQLNVPLLTLTSERCNDFLALLKSVPCSFSP
jgi:hypothetical protein